jgi:hypothetical protein
MRRRAFAFRWVLVAAAALAVAAFVNVVLLRAAQEEDDRVGRLRPLLVGVTEPAASETVTGSKNGAATSPTQTIDSTQTTTAPAPAATDDRGGGPEPGDDSGGHGGSSDHSERGDGDDD